MHLNENIIQFIGSKDILISCGKQLWQYVVLQCCDVGWIARVCVDYLALSGTPGAVSTRRKSQSLICWVIVLVMIIASFPFFLSCWTCFHQRESSFVSCWRLRSFESFLWVVCSLVWTIGGWRSCIFRAWELGPRVQTWTLPFTFRTNQCLSTHRTDWSFPTDVKTQDTFFKSRRNFFLYLVKIYGYFQIFLPSAFIQVVQKAKIPTNYILLAFETFPEDKRLGFSPRQITGNLQIYFNFWWRLSSMLRISRIRGLKSFHCPDCWLHHSRFVSASKMKIYF